MNNMFAFLDIETTGLNPETDEILEIGAVIAKDGQIIDTFNTLLFYDHKLPNKIKNLTGITESMLNEAPEFSTIKEGLIKFLGNLPIIGHNIDFDISFLSKKMGIPLGNPLIDTLDLVGFLLPQALSFRLENVRLQLGIEGGTAHRALDDAITTCNVFYSCLSLLKNLSSEVLIQIYKLINDKDWILAKFLTEIISECISKFPTEKTNFPYAFQKVNLLENDNLFSNLNQSSNKINHLSLTRVNQPNLANENQPVGIIEMMGKSGPFSIKMPNYRYRIGQIQMLKTVLEGLRQSKHMVIEAGTGTGKSLAYLLPAIAWSLESKSKVVIATHTISLQEQLWNKDIPSIKEVTGLDFEAALVKGRNNYLCLRKWEEKLVDYSDLEISDILFCLKILVWLTNTLTGDKSEINILPIQNQFWNNISSDQESCIGAACPWFHKNCFVSRARRQAESADILIVNHSLLLADIKLQNRLLPEYNYLVIDEAHHLEDSATDQLGWTIDFNQLKSLLISLSRGFRTGFSPGMLNHLKYLLKKNTQLFEQTDYDKLENIINDSFDLIKKIHDSIGEMEVCLKSWVSYASETAEVETYNVFRIKDSLRETTSWKMFLPIKENYIFRTMSIIQCFRKILNTLEKIEKEQQKIFITIFKDLEYQICIFEEINSNLTSFINGIEDNVYWIEVDNGKRQNVKIKSAPIAVHTLLYELLFQNKKSVLLTSATLCVDGDFKYILDRTGLDLFTEDKLIKLQVTSPFNYEQQSLLTVVNDIPDPTSVEENEYIEAITPVIANVAKLLNGKTLVLFTAHKMLKEVYLKLMPMLESYGINLLGHRIDGGRSRLIDEFKKDSRTVLLGANSFWEGVDFSGDVLKCVIIVKLPFTPPSTPVVEARIEELVKNKQDAFYGYTLPEAVIKFKQGFGRLIRIESDEGVVVVLDPRLIDRKYGRKFLKSLPVKTHFKGESSAIIQKAFDWFNGERLLLPSLNILDNATDVKSFLQNVKGSNSGVKVEI